VKNGGEIATDCGGPCAACVDGTPCSKNADCQSGNCIAGTCQTCGGQDQACCPGSSCKSQPLACIANNSVPWGNAAAVCECGVLRVDQGLHVGELVSSCDGRFFLVMQGDGNLVLYWNGHGALWSSVTGNTSGNYAVFQTDGNFVVYGNNGALWASGTQVKDGRLAVQDDGNLVVYGPDNAVYWSSNTCCH
jgi:hypothetical protein